jgi:hypothetical protein
MGASHLNGFAKLTDGLFELVELSGNSGERISVDAAHNLRPREIGQAVGATGREFGLQTFILVRSDVKSDCFRMLNASFGHGVLGAAIATGFPDGSTKEGEVESILDG